MLIPLKVDVPTSRRPWVNCALIVAIVWVSITAFHDEDLFQELAGIELRYEPGPGLRNIGVKEVDPESIKDDPHMRLLVRRTSHLTTKNYPLAVLAVTSSVIHGGWMHLVGNMLFLWVFGNSINYKFGHLGYLGLYLAAAMAGGLAHYHFSDIPCAGASGAINGVMGAFLVFFPRNDVTVFWMWNIIIHRAGRISSGWIILFWVVWDALMLRLGTSPGIALWAHLGGFAAGFGVALLAAITGLVKPTQDEQTLLQVLFAR